MEKRDYTISDIYQGGYSTFKPNYGDVFTGYRVNPGRLGLTTDPRTANILQDVSTKLNAGIKQIEVTAVSPEIFDSIPKQQLKEVNRLSKLTGVDISLHGPVIDSAGMSQQGFSELNREGAERRITDVLLRSHELDPNGNIPVTFHASEGIPGSEWKTLGNTDERKAKRLIAVDIESGRMVPVEEEKGFYPGQDLSKPRVYSPEESLKNVNQTEWDNKLSQLFFNKERADEILQQNYVQIQHLLEDYNAGRIKEDNLTPSQRQAWMKYNDARNYLQQISKSANNMFSKAYEFGTDEQKAQLKRLSEEYKEDLEKNGKDIMEQSKAMHELLIKLQDPLFAPTMYVPIEKFAIEKSSETFGNSAFNAYKKFGDKAPVLSIENPPAGFGLSTGEDLKNLIQEARNQFANRAVEEQKISRQEAEKLAQKFIGATWDVGHINMLRKQGFREEDIVKESQRIAPFVKHVHLSDNFGFEHTELPMGMGNVPVKQILENLGKEGFDARKIVEAAQWWQHWRTPPFKESMEAFGSPIYSMQMTPSWNQNLGYVQDYNLGLAGQWLPQINYETWGTGFSRLPAELGGQRPGAEGSRMSGRGME